MSQSQNIQVFVRCRPLNDQEKQSFLGLLPERREIQVQDRNSNALNDTRVFHFDQVFGPEARQNDIYKSVVKPLIDQVLLGFNCTVFAYGQTGTGKTYTMEGEQCDDDVSWEEDPLSGVIPRAISQILDSLKQQDNEFSLRVSFLELYNEDAYDLLSNVEDTTKLRIFDDVHKKGSVIVGGLEEQTVSSKQEIFDILKRGSIKRQTAATLLNACSSRSHTIFNVTVHIKESSTGGAELIRIGKLNLVDLAGSENVGRSGAQDKRAREAGNINQSLLTLGRVITALVEKRPHVPYRESKLTRILQDSLGGTTRTSIIATISPSDIDLTNTISTLDYASRARNIVNRPESNQQLTQKRTLVEFNREIQALMDKHSIEMCELEFKVRNEVALEFRREMEKMKHSFKELYDKDCTSLKDTYESQLKDAFEQRDKLAYQLQEAAESRDRFELQLRERTEERDRFEAELKQANVSADEFRDKLVEREEYLKKQLERFDECRQQKDDLSQMVESHNREMKVANQLAEYRSGLVAELEEKLKTSELELRTAREENRDLRGKLSENQEVAQVKKAVRVRDKAPVLEECGEYANLTFDGGDELIQVSAKKARKKVVAGAKKRQINHSIILSGKKRKIKVHDEEAELSPIPVTNTRVTRSRATRRKLDF